MAIIKKEHNKRPVIDLTGPEGNAYSLLGYATSFGQQLDMSKEEIEAIKQDMKSSDYEHLIQVFDKHFGEYVDLER